MTSATGSAAEAAPLAEEDGGAELLARARAGERQAFARLVEREYGFIFAVAYKWCGNRADAEDAAQDVCIKLGEGIRGMDGRASLRTWLYRVTLNAVRDLQRAQSRAVRRIGALASVSAESEPAEQEAAVALAELWRAVQALPERQRDSVMLVHAEGMSHAEAAAILECREATVSWHVHAARKTLKGLL